MYLRGLRHRSIINKSQTQRLGTLGSITGRSRACLTREKAAEGLSQGRTDKRASGSDRKNGQPYPKRSSIRPITVFAVSIPLGFALSWYWKEQNGNESVTVDGFVKYTLSKKEDISSTCSIFTLKPATSSPISTTDPSLERAITSVQFKQPQLQIARNYTLLPRVEGQNPDELRFLIRRERNGEVSGYLHRLPIGTEIELRGVSADYILPKGVETVVFLAGGTGIAPAMQVSQALAGEADVHVLWAARKREDCAGGVSDTTGTRGGNWTLWNWWQKAPDTSQPQEKCAIVAELDVLKQIAAASSPAGGQTKLLIDYFVDQEGTFVQPSQVQKLLKDASSSSRGAGKKLLFVSGPEGFISHWAAPKQWVEGREVQGRLGGVLSTLDLSGWEVIKL